MQSATNFSLSIYEWRDNKGFSLALIAFDLFVTQIYSQSFQIRHSHGVICYFSLCLVM